MDQKSLVTEQIQAAKDLINRFDKQIPVAVAFWLRPNETNQWWLYLAPEPDQEGNVLSGYREVVRLVGEMQNPEINLSQIKLIPANGAMARAALDACRHYPTGRVLEFEGNVFGDVSVGEAYFYPLPAHAPSP